MAPTDDGNGRVTMARLDERMVHLQQTMDLYHRQQCEELREFREERRTITADHEARLRALEAKERRGVWADIGAFVTGAAAMVAAVLTGKP